MNNEISESVIFPNEELDLVEAVNDLEPKIDSLLEEELKKYHWTKRIDNTTKLLISKDILDAAVVRIKKKYAKNYVNDV